ncbi:Uncharacterised protein [Campylobacter jejuni]|nr:Uncharacterised protein [Campylobacter jejuni]
MRARYGFVCKTPSHPPPSQGEEQSQNPKDDPVGSLPCEGKGWGGVLNKNQKVRVRARYGFVCKTPSHPPPSQGEEQSQNPKDDPVGSLPCEGKGWGGY